MAPLQPRSQRLFVGLGEYDSRQQRRIVMSNAPDIEVELTPEVLAEQLAHEGAIFTQRESVVLVGFLTWLGPNRIFYFAANGDDPEKDGHLVTFDSTKAERSSEVTFWKKDRLVGTLTRIDDGEFTDAGDFRAAWRVWQLKRPLCERLIGASLSHHIPHWGRGKVRS